MGKRCNNNYLDGKICKKKKNMPCIKNKALSTNIAYVNFMLFITNSYYYGPGNIDYNDGTSTNRHGALNFFIKKEWDVNLLLV